MIPLTEDLRHELAEMCRRHRVRRLLLFGSAVSGEFDPDASDVDVLVEFAAMPPVQYAESYFSLQEDLQRLFCRPVDLVEPGAIRNPYFRSAVEETKVVLYDAA